MVDMPKKKPKRNKPNQTKPEVMNGFVCDEKLKSCFSNKRKFLSKKLKSMTDSASFDNE